ncbi:Verticillium wilt disease resistance-like protein [Theobroma cacao]|uniref:Verticillium wilt disease resistance-like protein n=1 Tax=Theobroma cacao TaxID=3641 RepID=A0A061EJL6_THECC|nr:Verticillium wilt disease resistance-like protein [Theobroma cacao]
MNMENLHVLSLFLPTFFLLSCSIPVVSQCLDDPRSALLQLQQGLYHSHNFTLSSKSELWDVNTDCCSWKGVTCDALGHVIGLDLSYRELSSNFQSVFNLHHIRREYFNSSTEWCQTAWLTLPNLRVLSLSDCGLPGSLCSSLSKLHFLSKLNLNPNPISYLPPNFLKISSRLVSLNLSCCNLSGHFPTEVFLSLKMQSIDISQNHNLEGQLPTFPLNSTLKVLSLCGTNFSGKLPESLGNVKFLTKLELSLCNFSRQIPSTIANLRNLVHLNLEFNNFSGLIPSFHRSGVPNLAYLNLQRNRLSGPVHSSIFTLPSLHTLLLGGNQLVGEIDEFPNASCSLMQYLDLNHNYLSGSIPKSIVQLPRLELLSIGYNSFGSMRLDMLSQLKNLRARDLSNESLTSSQGSLPRSICNLTQLKYFSVSNNKLSGSIPNCLGNISNLSLLQLGGNNFTGIFYGTIQFSEAEKAFSMLHILDLASSKFSGDLSAQFLQCFKAMMLTITDNKAKPKYVGDGYYHDSVTIVNKGNAIFYEKILSVFTCLDLSNNSFHGRIPEEIRNLI